MHYGIALLYICHPQREENNEWNLLNKGFSREKSNPDAKSQQQVICAAKRPSVLQELKDQK